MTTAACIGAFLILGAAEQPARSAVRSVATPSMTVHGRAAPQRRIPSVMPTAERLRRGRQKSVSRIVYGYYRGTAPGLTAVRWEAITHLAWFAVGLNEFGAITGSNGWPDTTAVAAAHAAGVRLDLTFTLFDPTAIGNLLADPARRQTAVGNMVDQMVAGDADGVSVDLETPPGAARDNFSAFIAELRAEMDSRGLTASEITIAIPAVDWNAAMDLDALLDHASYVFIMGYGFFYSGSSRAGPSGLLRITNDWTGAASRSLLRSIAEYTTQIPAAKRQQIILGVPWYGLGFQTNSDAIGSTVVSFEDHVHYHEARVDLDTGGRTRQYDPGIQSPYYMWQDAGGWHQVWYEDNESLAAKYQLAIDQDLAGVGFWVADSAGTHPDLWDGLEAALGAEPPTPEGHRYNPIPITTFPFHDARDSAAGPSQYFNFYGCLPGLSEYGKEWVYRVDLCQPGILSAHVPDLPNIDPDLHLLTDADQEACLDRAHTDLQLTLEPGGYLLTVDTWVDGNEVELEGPFDLDVSFTPTPGSQPCDVYLVCSDGSCICPDPSTVDCGAGCVDLQSDAENCGSCNQACDAGEACQNGVCVAAPPTDAGDATGIPPDAGCPPGGKKGGCQQAAGACSPAQGAGVTLMILLLLIGATRRRRLESGD